MCEDADGDEDPGFRVEDAFEGLVTSPLFVDCVVATCAGDGYAVFGVLLFFFGEKFGVVDGVWEEEEEGDGPECCSDTEDLVRR